MNALSKQFFGLVFVTILIALSGCGDEVESGAEFRGPLDPSFSNDATQVQTTSESSSNALLAGTVVDGRNIANCQFLIQLDGGQLLVPINLPQAARRSGLRVSVAFVARNDVANGCLAGTAVQLTDLRGN